MFKRFFGIPSKKQNRAQRRTFIVETLEDRNLMATMAGGRDTTSLPVSTAQGSRSFTVKSSPSTVNRAAVLVDDSYEQNDSLRAARHLGSLNRPLTVSNLVIADSNDWYKFTATTKPRPSDTVSIQLANSQGDLDLALYNGNGQRLRYSGTTNNTEQISLGSLAAGTYYIRVYGYLGAKNPTYALNVNLTGPLTDDAYENNDSLSTAKRLGTLSSATTIASLVMADTHDWYQFTMGGAGASTDFVAITSTSTQGNLNLELYNSAGTRLAASSGTANNEQISLSGRAAGTYYVHVLGYNSAKTPNYSLQIVPGVPTNTPSSTSSSTSSAFDIQFRFSGLTAAERSIFEQAAAKWESIIVGDLSSATYAGIAVDDLLIDARSVFIDGTGRILGQAGPDALRSGSRLPYHGTMEFDSADLASLLSNGTLLSVIEHEMGHVLGIGTIWNIKGLLVGAGTTNPSFVGAQATAAYNSVFGTNLSGVPVENTGGAGTRDGHWRESILGSELMTGWVGPGTYLPLSRITIGSLADLGYTVSYAALDNFTPAIASSGALLSATLAGTSTATVSATANIQSTSSLDLLSEVERRKYHDTALVWLAARKADHDQVDTLVSEVKSDVYERATDVLMANWLHTKALHEDFLRSEWT